MSMGLILALSLLFGMLLLLIAGAVALSERGGRLRQHLLMRYATAGASTNIAGGNTAGQRSVGPGPVSLRREAESFSLPSLFDLGELDFMAITRVSRRLLGLMGLGFVVLVGLAVFGVGLSVLNSVLLALAIVFTVAFLVHRHRYNKRIADIAENVPEALDMLVRW